MKNTSVYLNFNGNAEEAFLFYKSVFGGESSYVMRFRETPEGGKMPAAEGEKLMHIALPIQGGFTLMASDVVESYAQKAVFGSNFYIYLETESVAEADRVFGALCAGGKVEMALENTFWGAYYGSLIDKFGVQWMVSFTPPAKT
jgi:PhnB protein